MISLIVTIQCNQNVTHVKLQRPDGTKLWQNSKAVVKSGFESMVNA